MFARKAILPVDVEMEKEEASDALLNVYPNLQVVQYTISLFSFCTFLYVLCLFQLTQFLMSSKGNTYYRRPRKTSSVLRPSKRLLMIKAL